MEDNHISRTPSTFEVTPESLAKAAYQDLLMDLKNALEFGLPDLDAVTKELVTRKAAALSGEGVTAFIGDEDTVLQDKETPAAKKQTHIRNIMGRLLLTEITNSRDSFKEFADTEPGVQSQEQVLRGREWQAFLDTLEATLISNKQ